MTGRWMRMVAGEQVDFSGETWKHPKEKLTIAFGSVSLPGGYPSAFDAGTVELLRAALADDLSSGAMGWPTGVSYATNLGRLSAWLFGTGISGPGRTFCLSGIDMRLAESYFGFAAIRLGIAKSQSDLCRYSVQWAYDHAVRAGVPGCTEETNLLLTRIKPRHLVPPPPSGEVRQAVLPAEPDLPRVPLEFDCEGKRVQIQNLLLMRADTKPSIGLERIVRPAGRASSLSPRAQQLALLFVVRQIEEGAWTRHQILNAVDHFGCWLGHHPQWGPREQAFQWSDLSPELASAYHASSAGEAKGNDWWAHIRALYRWGVPAGHPDFTADVLQRLNAVGWNASLHADTRSRFVPDPDLPPIPTRFRTRDENHSVETSGPGWQRRDAEGRGVGASINLARLDDPPGDPARALFSLRFLHCVRLFLADQGEREWAWGTLESFVDQLLVLQNWLADRGGIESASFGPESLTPALLKAHRTHLEGPSGPGYSARISYLRTFYGWGVQRKLPGFSEGALASIKELRLRNAPRGELVKARDPVQGAFSMTEQRVLRERLDDPDWGTPEERALVMLCWLLGPRPIQIGELRWKHLARYATPMAVSYVLSVPRAKKRTPDATTVARSLGGEPDLGPLLESLHAPDSNPDAPLFPTVARYKDAPQGVAMLLDRWAVAGGAERPLRTARLRDAAGGAAPMPLSPYRFRRTMATNMARQRASPDHIMKMLDDDDERMALVYVENIEELVNVLGETLDTGEYFEIVGGWYGETELAEHGHLPEVRGRTLPILGQDDADTSDLGGIGRCGAGALCDLEWPLNCYPCPKFKPRPGGPHVQMLARAERLLGKFKAAGNDRMSEIFKRICEKISITVEAERRRAASIPAVIEVSE